jgi:hypothetical protein
MKGGCKMMNKFERIEEVEKEGSKKVNAFPHTTTYRWYLFDFLCGEKQECGREH